MPRLYFTDPIKALYMMREFGVRFLHPKYDEDVFIDNDKSASYALSDLEYYLSKGPLIVSPSAEHIFEPKGNDFGFYYKHNNLRPVKFIEESKIGGWIDLENYYVVTDQVLITMRDNKQFFAAEVENN